jgi:NAD(P)-dependent dehydrogenase (short-subunit alcohol dehydrogenase family)
VADEKLAVVTGGNKGIGLEICRQLARAGVRVILTARDENKGQAACEVLRKENLEVVFQRLDVTDAAGILTLAQYVEKEFGRLDILINNAGIDPDKGGRGLEVEMEIVQRTMDANVYGPWRLCQALIPLMRKSKSGRIVNVSSRMGSLGQLSGSNPAYRISKACLNALTLILADELQGTGITVNGMNPGWVKSDMGGSSAPRSAEEGADTAVWLALHPGGGPTGKFFMDREEIVW